MPAMPDTKKRRVRLRVELDVCRKVIKEYGRPSDENDNLAFIRCLEESVRDVELNADDWKAIYEEERANEIKRKKGKTE